MMEQQLPEGWQMVKFGDIAKHISVRVEPGNTDLKIYVGLEHLESDSLKIKRYGVPADVEGQKLLVKKGQIIFCKRRAYQRKVAVAEWDCICSTDAMVLEANPASVIPEFLPFFMQSDVFVNRVITHSEGYLSPRIKWKVLAEQYFLFPSKSLQQKMLPILSSCNLANLHNDATLESLLLFRRIFFREQLLKLKKIGQVSTLKLGDVCRIITGRTPPPHNQEYWGGDIPFVTPGDISNDILYVNNSERYITDKGLEKTLSVPKGAVLLTCIGSTIGKAAIASCDVATNQQINSMICSEAVLPEYLLVWIQNNLEVIKKYAGIQAVPIINKSTLANIDIDIPCVEEQSKLVKVVIEKDSLSHKLRKKNAILTNLTKSFFVLDVQ
ncbi:TPA: restriction endonuclease subunit S [Escherichia coli]|uniref:restriction endonuclease subunit S n=2 Tax=Escherichia coli TaxID=562 RepID=UPI0012EBB321|nr:restriction endonuclease subunit S [Escherichia coli]MCK2305780.1 restriction endonuclease subunit S [Escherichia coli]MCV8052900.1 restriction endonuclease subunit S [Escherichia coli]MDF9105155.1 restriction endonuclease subunit S [Escherichia coli]HAN6308853.1 restriction endonuclease subunit S [Escherichia coli]HAN6349281.1 restriction endonuclease subunit S [Escherichia coli]